tara:strand:+ start:205 stop:342 length:138 start_codon:yes stop_codon:yes gene_type:complete
MEVKYINIKKLPSIRLTVKKKQMIKIKTKDLSDLIDLKSLLQLKI